MTIRSNKHASKVGAHRGAGYRLCRPTFETLETRFLLFKPYTHLEIGKDVLEDIQDSHITIQGQEYLVDAAVVAALKNHPDFYNAGVVGPDGFPDLIMGQGVIHPVNTGRWLQHVLDSAWDAQTNGGYSATERSQILAWSYGFLTHAAGDLWAHTLVNEFAEGVFPAVGDILTDADKAAIAVRHILVENYIGDATIAFDGNSNRTGAPGGDVSDDSTPHIDFPSNSEFGGMADFIYESLIVPQDASLRLPTDRGAAIDFFLNLKAGLQSAIVGPVNPLQGALDNFSDTRADLEDSLDSDDCNFEDALDIVHDTVACPIALGTDIAIGSFNAAKDFVTDSIKAAFGPLFDAYLGAWIEDIDAGLAAWGEGIGLRSTRALFDPQARRNLQNLECASEGPENEADRGQCESDVGLLDVVLHEIDPQDRPNESFINNHLLSMLGLPDFVGDLRTLFTEFSNVVNAKLDALLGPIEELAGVQLNPVELAIDQLQMAAKGLIKDQIESHFGISVDELQDFFDRPSSKMGLKSVDLAGIGIIDVFQPGDRAKLDGYLGITGAPLDTHFPLGSADVIPIFTFHSGAVGGLRDGVTFNKESFAAYANAVTTSKLLLLDGPRVDNLIADVIGSPYELYSPAGMRGNVMAITFPNVEQPALPTDPTEGASTADVNVPHPSDPQDRTQWLRSIDGDHAWRRDGQPIFPLANEPAYASAGNGSFPLWESCLLRDDVFRTVFRDWENGSIQFPDYGDSVSHDPNELPPRAMLDPITGVLTILGTNGDDVLELEIFVDGNGAEFVRLAFPGGTGYCAGTIDTPLSDVTKIVMDALPGDDLMIIAAEIPVDVDADGSENSDILRVDYVGGFDRRITFDGGPGNDLLQLIGGDDNFTGTYNVGFAQDRGVITYLDGTGYAQVVAFEQLEPIDDLVLASSYTINASGLPDVISITDGPIVLGAQTTRVDFQGAFEEDRFANKPTVTINGLGREDAFNVNIQTPGELLETLNVTGGTGSDLFLLTPYDNDVQVNVEGGFDGQDRLVVVDEGVGNLVLHRQDHLGRNGSVTIGALLPVGYEQVETVNVTPLNSVTGGTGSDFMGQIAVFQQDMFEPNDTRRDATLIGSGPTIVSGLTIDPGSLALPAPFGSLPGDEDWYEIVPTHDGIVQFQVLFSSIPTLSNGQPGLPGDGHLTIEAYNSAGTQLTNAVTNVRDSAGAMIGNGIAVGVHAGRSYTFRVRGATTQSINSYDVRVVDLDTIGPQVINPDALRSSVHISDDPTTASVDESLYDLFGLKPSSSVRGVTPVISGLTINIQDLSNRVPENIYRALDETIARHPGHYSLKGDHNGIIPISAVTVNNVAPGTAGAPAFATIRLTFADPLPDDRFTLTISDAIVDPAGNRLDGETNLSQPQVGLSRPSGDGNTGGQFLARFTVDSRPEVGSWSSGSVYVDTNGNFMFDPQNPDFTNRDIVYTLGFTSDEIFAGDFAGIGAIADGFDKLASYGRLGSTYRWLVDLNHDGSYDPGIDIIQSDLGGVNGYPVAGNWDGNAANGEEVGLFTGSVWWFDMNHDFRVDTSRNSGVATGYPVAGDFNADGIEDCGSWSNDAFEFDLSCNGSREYRFSFGFAGVLERPVASDMNADGYDDVGLWVPHRSGASPEETGEWYFLISDGGPVFNRLIADPQFSGQQIIPFSPIPFGPDIYSQWGDQFALPVVGNFDPPLSTSSSSSLANVAGVYVGSGAWSEDFRGRIDAAYGYGYSLDLRTNTVPTLPWTDLNQISVKFDTDVFVSMGDLTVRDVNGTTFPAASLKYTSTTKTATWTFDSFLSQREIIIELNTTGVTQVPSRHIRVATGDINGDGLTNLADSAMVMSDFGASATHASYLAAHDINGDGRIGLRDLLLLRNFGTGSVAASPAGASHAPAALAARASDQAIGQLPRYSDLGRSNRRIRRPLSEVTHATLVATDRALVTSTDDLGLLMGQRSRRLDRKRG